MTCDCLAYCGDDPDIRKGKVVPCEAWKQQQPEYKISQAKNAGARIATLLSEDIDQEEAVRIIREEYPTVDAGLLIIAVYSGISEYFSIKDPHNLSL